MKTTSLHCYDHRKTLHVVVFLVAMLSIRTQSANAMAADLVPQDSRVSVAADNFKNAWQYAVAYQLRPPRRLRARHLELALGQSRRPAELTRLSRSVRSGTCATCNKGL
jgi:hypothetical protein